MADENIEKTGAVGDHAMQAHPEFGCRDSYRASTLDGAAQHAVTGISSRYLKPSLLPSFGAVPALGLSAFSSASASPFSISSSPFSTAAAPPSFGAKAFWSAAGNPAPSAAAIPQGYNSTSAGAASNASPCNAVASSTPPSASANSAEKRSVQATTLPSDPIKLEVRAGMFGHPSLSVCLPGDATVGALIGELQSRLALSAEESAQMSLFCAGQRLVTQSATLQETAAKGIVHCLKQSGTLQDAATNAQPHARPDSASVGSAPAAMSPAAAAAAGRAATAAAARAASCNTSGAAGSSAGAEAGGSAPYVPAIGPSRLVGGTPSEAHQNGTIRVRFANNRELELPFVPTMTTVGLKREVERRGEAPAAQLRFFFSGRELHDSLPLGAPQTRLTAGAVVIAVMQEPSAGRKLGAEATSMSTHAGSFKQTRFVGLQNAGATCYLNSMLQALYMTPQIRRAVQTSSRGGGRLCEALASIFDNHPLRDGTVIISSVHEEVSDASLSSSSSAVSTSRLTSALRASGGIGVGGQVLMQEDVHEFWQVLCDKVETELKGSENELMLTKLFQGKQCYSVTCCECGHTSHTDDVFEDLKLPMLTESQGHALGSGAPEEQSSAASATNGLRRTLRNLLLPEALRGDEQYWCDHCARKVDAERRVSLCSLPPILAFQLKRFRYDLRTGQRSKINSSLPFPTELDMSEFVSDPRSRGTDVVQTSCQESGPTGTDGLNKPVSQEAARNDREADEGGDSGSKGDSTAAESGGGGSGDGGEAQCNSGFGAACRGDSAEAAEVVREKSLQYELYAVLVHSGSASFGHYYALIKDLEEGDWHEFNDSVVRPIKASDLSKTFGGAESGWGASAYMLLYRQVDATHAANANERGAANADGRECIRSMSPTSEATSSVEAHACVVGGDGDGAMDADGFVVVKRNSRHSKRSRREQSTASQAQGAQDISNDLVDKILKDSLETDLSDKKKEEEDPNPYTAMGF